jgi:hypothetical protein
MSKVVKIETYPLYTTCSKFESINSTSSGNVTDYYVLDVFNDTGSNANRKTFNRNYCTDDKCTVCDIHSETHIFDSECTREYDVLLNQNLNGYWFLTLGTETGMTITGFRESTASSAAMGPGQLSGWVVALSIILVAF